MMHSIKVLLYCLLIFYIGVWGSCNKHFDCRGTIHSFKAFFKAYSAKDSIRIGDTIWIELQTSTELRDLTTNKIINFSGATNFSTVIGYIELKGGDLLNTGAFPAANYFINVLKNGFVVPSIKPEQVREFRFEEKGGMYLFKVGIIPTRRGLFLLGISDASEVVQKGNNCDKSDIALKFKDTDQHMYLLEQSRPGYTPSEYEQTHSYCFKVY